MVRSKDIKVSRLVWSVISQYFWVSSWPW